ncbi:hypothetical protein DM01DRAFT_1111707 [Hesseltinella vesiculosa]|uniref:Uncharacterized protein n=1 Tax=Hesseltinella vesiculosa TaxID=101127 RepID=A0A1X2GAR1_9FUNG|nr:hypothetical protein DM01DRAFT_1111707 [Hesseltinella vesiculosa]
MYPSRYYASPVPVVTPPPPALTVSPYPYNYTPAMTPQIYHTPAVAPHPLYAGRRYGGPGYAGDPCCDDCCCGCCTFCLASVFCCCCVDETMHCCYGC